MCGHTWVLCICICGHAEEGLRLLLGITLRCSFPSFIQAGLTQTQSSLLMANPANQLALETLFPLPRLELQAGPPCPPDICVGMPTPVLRLADTIPQPNLR